MSVVQKSEAEKSLISLHGIGVLCGLAAGAWLGTAEAPVKMVASGVPPFIVTLGMVLGVFIARWSIPMLLKGSGFVLGDLRRNAHLIVWGLLAGMLWVIANTLTVYAIKNVGLSIAFPLWNMNCLVGLFWGWLFFNELRGAGWKGWSRVFGGSLLLVVGAAVLAWATADRSAAGGNVWLGIVAALGAGLLWGTQYISYRKAYISGINPLSFVTVIAFSELISTLILGTVFAGGIPQLGHQLMAAKPYMFWLFCGGICWVFGDLFQQYAAKYIGIGRGIPLSNTNQLWGLAWGALVFGELGVITPHARLLVLVGSLIMIVGAAFIGAASASASEVSSWNNAMNREINRYHLDRVRVEAVLKGEDPLANQKPERHGWEYALPVVGLALLLWLGASVRMPAIALRTSWMMVLLVASLGLLMVSGFMLWKRTRFS
ncbi:EamA family transporter [Telmatobacter bradus]|uniref:EamA family transporter n=1 Tax=Telmatobacter bradus TaxID=474953 RepID=UPI003B42A268